MFFYSFLRTASPMLGPEATQHHNPNAEQTFFNKYMNSWQCDTVPDNSPQFWGNPMMQHNPVQHYLYTASAQQKHAAPSHFKLFYGKIFMLDQIFQQELRSMC